MNPKISACGIHAQEDWAGPRPDAAVLFLDIDGVVHPRRSDCFRYMPAIERLLHKYPGLDIVLTTGRREMYGRDVLIAPFPPTCRDRVRGVTPVLTAPWPRHAEICDYVRRHNVQRWLAVDDDETQFPDGCENLFLVDPFMALCPENEQALASRLAAIVEETSCQA